MAADDLVDAGFALLFALTFLALGLAIRSRLRAGKYRNAVDARAGAWLSFGGSGVFLVLAVRELLGG